MSDDLIELSAGGAAATVALRGAEPLSWRVGGRELLWYGDQAHWGFRAPILFPVVGASKGGVVQVAGTSYPMPQHGFARHHCFSLVETGLDFAHLRLTDGPETRAHYPFAFALDIRAKLGPASLSLDFAVTNTGEEVMPYGLGFHPAFLWPFDAPDRAGHRVEFETAERPHLPEIAAGGLLACRTRSVPMAGQDLPLAPELFSEALVFLEARSRRFSFVSPSGAAIELAVEAFPHLAVWSRPDAPFLSLEAWTAHADWEDADGDLLRRPSMTHLQPGDTGRHAVTMRWIEDRA